ncbi:MAG: type II secretion system F family protein [Pirellulales bacterium]
MSKDSSVSFSIDDLLSINDEIIALCRSNVPVDRGLKSVAADLKGNRAELAREIADKLEQGQTLGEAIASFGTRFPAFYQAVIQAGIKSGNLTTALEGVSLVARRLQDLRTAYWLALPYPLIVVSMAGLLMCFFGIKIAPTFAAIIEAESFESDHWIYPFVEYVKKIFPYGIFLLPLAILLMITWWFSLRSPRTLLQNQGMLRRFMSGLARVAALSRQAIFFDCLALMIRNQVPLHQAIQLSSAATGNPKFAKAGKQWSESLARGEQVDFPLELSPLGKWLMRGNGQTESFASWLELSATRYHREATRLSEWLSSALPVFLTLCIGGTAVLIYALSLFLPWVAIMQNLNESI